MNSKDIEIGKTYAVRVSGVLRPVTVLVRRQARVRPIPHSGGWKCHNIVTGRTIVVKDIKRFRYEERQCAECLRWMAHWFTTTKEGRTLCGTCGE